MGSNSTVSVNWMFPVLRRRKVYWTLLGNLTVASIGLLSKVLIEWLNKPEYYNIVAFNKILEQRPTKVPLITISNHYSCIDDPALWGCLNIRQLCSAYRMRWSLAAHDICFTNKLHTYFFLLGKCIPVIRGRGVYQQAVDFCIERLQEGDWIHIFPEGKVNLSKEFLRLKWGVGRMIYEAPVTPIVIPIWHIGMDDILPNTAPYRLNIGKKITLNFGNPIDFCSIIKDLESTKASEMQARKIITEKIQSELLILRRETEELHLLKDH